MTKQLSELGTGRLALAARWDGMPGRSDLVALVLVATEGDEAGLGVLVPADLLGAASVVKKLNSVLARPFVGHEVKEAMRSLLPLGIDLTGLEMDTGVAAYLLDASTGEYELSQLREQTGQLQPRHRRAGRDRARPGPGCRWRGGRRRRHGRWASAAASAPRTWWASTTTSRRRWYGSSPKWRWPASAWTGPSCRRSPMR